MRIVVLDNGPGIPPEQGRRDLQAVRQHQGVARHRPGPGGQPQDPPRARRRHRGAEPGRRGQQVHPAAADQEHAKRGHERNVGGHPGDAAAGAELGDSSQGNVSRLGDWYLFWRELRAWKTDPDGIRTRVAALKGPCPRPLDDGAGNPLTHARTQAEFRQAV